MPVVGFHLHKINVERKEDLKEKNLNVQTKLSITDIREEKAEDLSKEKSVLSFDFDFNIEYEPDAAKIHFEGHVMYVDSRAKAKAILNDWKKKKIEEDLGMLIRNVVWTKCSLKSFFLEDEVGLPLHVPIPRIVKKSGSEFVG
ncbi:MAG: hypothetical protein AABX59_00555 [Nanoarchaeota archaeon]